MSHLPALPESLDGSRDSLEDQTTIAVTEAGICSAIQQCTNPTLLLEARGPSSEDSDSDILDVSQIVKTSDIVRRYLERSRYQNSSRDSDNSSASSDEDGMDVDVEIPSTTPPCTRGSEPEVRQRSHVSSLLSWNPSFLNSSSSRPVRPRQLVSHDTTASTSTPANVVGDIPHAELACDEELMAILAETEPHYYPLRKRSEKNMHPYTKLVWTDPSALRAPNGRRRDLSILEEPPISDPRGNSYLQNSLQVDPDNSEDDDYVPGMVEETANDTQNIEPVAEVLGEDEVNGGSLLPLLEHRQGLTYRHIAARRRQRLGRPPRKRPRNGKQAADDPGHRHQNRQNDKTHLPSLSSVLGLRHGDSGESSDYSANDASDPFGVPPFGDIHGKSIPVAIATTPARHICVANDGDVARSAIDLPHSEHHRHMFNSSELSSDDAEAASTNSPSGLRPRRQRRLLPRRHYDLADSDNQAQSELDGEVGLSAGALPTSRARKLSKLSRNQMRGILPFSFMRDLSRDKNQAIQEEVDRWKHSGSRGAPKRRILPSSPSDVGSEPANDREEFGLREDDAQAANDVSEMFSDLAIPSPRMDREALVAAHRSHFAFNFIDIYEWQYPPLAPEGSVDRAPDFLRIAAREARRQGVRAKSAPDDPSKKAIYICPRWAAEFEEEDIAQSILLSWSLGVIDLRRVYFSAEYGDSDSELGEYSIPAEEVGEDWPVHTDFLTMDAPALQSASIVLSDDDSEAAEDNTISVMSLGRSRSGSGHRTRPRQPSSRGKRQTNLFGASSGLLRSRGRSRKPSRHAPTYSHRQGIRAPPAAHKLTSVMNEFAALDSDSDADQGSGDDESARRRPDNRRPLVLDKGSSTTEMRRQRFISKFQRLPSSARGYSSRHGNPPRISRGQARRTLFHSMDNRPQSPARAEFLFDDDQARPAGQWRQASSKHQQTKLLSSRPEPRQVSASMAASKSADSKLDSVVRRLGKLQQKPVFNPRKASTQRRSRKSVPVRNIQPVAAPTRALMRNATYSGTRAVATKGWAARRVQDSDDLLEDDVGNPSLAAALTGDQCGTSSLASGTRFDNGMWISQGGISEVQRMLLCAYRSGVRSQAAAPEKQQQAVGDGLAGAYQYLDILRIDISATPAEFIQAYSMLFILWYEVLGSHSESHPNGSASDTASSVFRWIEYSQHYIVSKAGSKAGLSQLAQKLTGCARDSLLRLNQLAGRGKVDADLAALIALSFSVAVLQLALVFGGLLSVQGNLGPRAVGEEDELDSQWSTDRFKTEIDSCLKAAVRSLMPSDSVHRQKLRQLGPVEQIWAALIHLFPGRTPRANSSDSSIEGWSAMDVVPVADVWSTVLQACTSRANSDHQLAASLWSAIVYLLPLTQLNIEGIAAPHSSKRCHLALLQLVEAAAEKQLLGAERGAGDGRDVRLRPTEELAIRQAFFRIHGIVVDEEVSVGPSSPLFMTLYRYLESKGFCSLSIEPPPSLPRFFKRYCGSVDRASGPPDTCTMLWLKALDKSLGEWVAQLKALPAASKEHRRTLRDVRSTVSKLLPTRILTFDGSTAGTHLSTLANYYSVFILFLHAIPSDVVRSARLYSQLQSMLRFKESSSLTARRVYFEAWSAAATIITLNLKRALEACGSGATRVVDLLIASDTAAVGAAVPVDVRDYYGALMMAVGGWSESLGVVVNESSASSQRPVGGDMAPATALWGLADSALMYLMRVLTSSIVTEHTPSVLLLVLAALKSPSMLVLMTCSEAIALPAAYIPLLKRLLAVLGTWQRAVTAVALPDAGTRVDDSTECNANVVAIDNGGGKDSQMDFAMFDSMDLLDIAAEAAELERRAPFAAIDAAILQTIHEQYIPGLRQHIVQQFSALSSSAVAEQSSQRNHMRALELTARILAHMVSACVDAGLRTWESFLDEHGRDTLYLILDSYGRRLVLVQFAVAAIGVARAKGQQMEHLDVLLKNVWFASVCDLRLVAYVEQLAGLLAWADEKSDVLDLGYCRAPTVFVGALPVLRQRQLVDQSLGTLRDSVLDGDTAADTARDWPQSAAPLAVSLVGRVLKNVASRAGGSMGVHKQTLASWIARLLGTQQEVQADSRRRTHGIGDTRKLVDAMAERVENLVRDNCADLGLPPNV